MRRSPAHLSQTRRDDRGRKARRWPASSSRGAFDKKQPTNISNAGAAEDAVQYRVGILEIHNPGERRGEEKNSTSVA